MQILNYYHNRIPKKYSTLVTKWGWIVLQVCALLPTRQVRSASTIESMTIYSILQDIQLVKRHRTWLRTALFVQWLIKRIVCILTWPLYGGIQTVEIMRKSSRLQFLWMLPIVFFCEMYALGKTRSIIESIPGLQWPLDYYDHSNFHIAAGFMCLLLTILMVNTEKFAPLSMMERVRVGFFIFWIWLGMTSVPGYLLHNPLGRLQEPGATHDCTYWEFISVFGISNL